MEYIRRGNSPSPNVMPRMQQARYWICTIPRETWKPCLPEGAGWCIGQPEKGESGYLHWQVLVAFTAKRTMAQVKRAFGVNGMHLEPSRSDAARAYVHKEATRDGEPFEFGQCPCDRSSAVDWERVKELAKKGVIFLLGEFDMVPADIFIRYYRSLTAIAADHAEPVGMEKLVYVYYGVTGTGKSRRAWDEAGEAAYAKDPRSKFWCGYRSHEHVVIDEFRGGIDISHLLRWLDRYPVRVEIKGGSRPLMAKKVWITSNLHPDEWYPELDEETKKALRRRLQITYFPINIFT